MTYRIELSDTAQENLEVLDKLVAARISQKLESIKENPFNYVKRLKGAPLFSLRVGDYRIIMDIKNNQLLIFVMRIGHRRNVYEEL